MTNRHTPEAILIARQEDEAARKRLPPCNPWPSSPRPAVPMVRVAPMVRVPPRPPLPLPGTLTAARLKVTTTLDAAELLAIQAPENRPRAVLHIRLPGRVLIAEVTSKSLRRAQATIREAGTDKVAVTLQGSLAAGDAIVEAGLSAQPRTAKPTAP